MKLKAGFGYWAIDYYPIGGDFRRAPKTADLELDGVEQLDRPFKGATHHGWVSLPGIKARHAAAFNIAHCVD